MYYPYHSSVLYTYKKLKNIYYVLKYSIVCAKFYRYKDR